jgi:tetratricopeptide (TPR) repeat protein
MSTARSQRCCRWKLGAALGGALLLCAASSVLGQTAAASEQEILRISQQAEEDLHNEKISLAVTGYRKILLLDPNNIQAHANLGLAYYLQRKFASAAEQFEAALRVQPDLWRIQALCGLSENQSGEFAKAQSHLEMAFGHVSEQPLRIAVGKQLFSIYFEAGDLKRAADVVDDLQQIEPDNVDVLYAAHQVYSLLANRAFLSIARLQPDSPRMYQLRGDQMMQAGNVSGAVAAYREAVKRDSHLAGAHFALGEALSASQSPADRAQAEAEYEKALADNGRDERTECRLGAIEMGHSNFETATQHYKRALQLQPDDPEANEGLGMVLMALNSTGEAISYLRRAVELDPTNETDHYHLGLVSRNVGDAVTAKHEFEEFQRLKTQKEQLKHSLHYTAASPTSQAQEGKSSPN